jgi:acyl carrier protein
MISDKLKRIILDELSLTDHELLETTTASMVPGWDSLNHGRIIAAVEDGFGVRFKTAEIIRLRNVGDLQALVDQKTGAR